MATLFVIVSNIMILTDAEVLSEVLEREQESSRRVQWEYSPFKALVPQISIKRIGSIFEQFIIELCQIHSIDYSKPTSTDYDLMIMGRRIEIKGCTLGVNSTFAANQIRPQQGYDYVLLVCLSPYAIHYHLYTKAEAIALAKPQHSGGLETLQATIHQDDTYKRSESFLEVIQGII